jgi:hypothetical protein
MSILKRPNIASFSYCIVSQLHSTKGAIQSLTHTFLEHHGIFILCRAFLGILEEDATFIHMTAVNFATMVVGGGYSYSLQNKRP